MFTIPEELFKEPFNKISSDAKIIYAICLDDAWLAKKYESLGNVKQYYEQPKARTLDEVAEMTNLTFQQVYEAQEELKKAGLY